MIHTALNFSAQYSSPLHLFLVKYHHRGAQVGPCPEEPSTKSSILTLETTKR